MGGVFVYVQHLLGSGHLQRMARIARALALQGVSVDLCSGGMPVAALALAPARLHQLPPARCEAHDFRRLLDTSGKPVDAHWREARTAQLCQLAARLRPAIALIESYPFARRQMRFELQPLLAALRAAGCHIVCSIRDILQVKAKPERRRETLQVLAKYFDAVLVHGDPRLCTLADSFTDAADIACPVHYTGYVAAPEEPDRGRVRRPAVAGAGEVLVAAGGGAVGEPVYRAALQARAGGCAAARPWRVLLGTSLAAGEARRLRALLPVAMPGASVTVEPARADYPQLLRRAAVSISQAGYNTVVDVLAAGCPAVLIPYARHGEMEQSLRAERLARIDAAQVLAEDGLDATRLCRVLEQTLARPRAAPAVALDLAGAGNTAALLARWLRVRPPRGCGEVDT